jgi:uncharacterized membrane protein
MGKSRLEAFFDGVVAIIITIMVLEMKVPHGDSLDALVPLLPVVLSYVLSFIYLGIYWNNHHHMLHTCKQVTGAMLWANLHLLFWLSLIPFTTGWERIILPVFLRRCMVWCSMHKSGQRQNSTDHPACSLHDRRHTLGKQPY